MFNPCKEDSASGFPIEPPSSTHIIELSGDSKHVYPTRTFHSGPLVNPSKTGTSKHGEHHVRAVAEPRNFPVVVSAKSDARPDDSNVIGFTQAEAFAHGRRLSESINGHFSGSGKYDQVFQQKEDKSGGRVDGGAIVSNPKLVPNVEKFSYAFSSMVIAWFLQISFVAIPLPKLKRSFSKSNITTC